MKELVEPLIGVRVKIGNSSIWFYGWSEEGVPPSVNDPIIDLQLNRVWNNRRWDMDVITNSSTLFNFSWLHHKDLFLSDGKDDDVWKVGPSD
ncbi:hypothetical protein ACH5RR_023653 [Cinchona calisaya]|uniref:Uncharacterized protein n=1 Tax=Cinchona calisaya TaxID=153742 RepID=A0ABD2ZBA6_9GENT